MRALALLAVVLTGCTTLTWRVPWSAGDQFKIERYQQTVVHRAAYAVDDPGLPDRIEKETRAVFLARILEDRGEELSAEVTVEMAMQKTKLGEVKSTVHFVKGSGQKNCETGESMPVAPEFERTYFVRFDRAGRLVQWEGTPGVLACLQGLGNADYNAFTSLLTIPKEQLRIGSEWTAHSHVDIAHGGTIRFQMECRLKSPKPDPGYLVNAEILPSPELAERLRTTTDRIGKAYWVISPDLKEVVGEAEFEMRNKLGAPMVQWCDIIRVRPIDKP